MQNETITCTECNAEADAHWVNFQHKVYGYIFLEAGVCRKCWNDFMRKENRAEQRELDAAGYRSQF